jgi:hypothetical protein
MDYMIVVSNRSIRQINLGTPGNKDTSAYGRGGIDPPAGKKLRQNRLFKGSCDQDRPESPMYGRSGEQPRHNPIP